MISEEERTRYDRQVRLWGSGVQQRLLSTVLIAFGCTADETLKNLVLAGIGRIRIVPTCVVADGVKPAEFLSRSVVALSGGARNGNATTTGTDDDSAVSGGGTAEAIVQGLRQLNNLVHVKTFDPTEDLSNAACVMALVEPSQSAMAALNQLPVSVVSSIDLFVNVRLLTPSFAFCEFSRRAATASRAGSLSAVSSQQQQQPKPPLPNKFNNKFNNTDAAADDPAAAAGSGAAAVAAHDYHSSVLPVWQTSCATPPVAHLLMRGAELASSSSSPRGATTKALLGEDDENECFTDFMSKMLREEPTAMGAVGPAAVEMVAAETLLLHHQKTSSSSTTTTEQLLPTIALNAMLGGVMSQQIIAHACMANSNKKKDAAAPPSSGNSSQQPKPVHWLFVQMKPHIECIVGDRKL